MIPARQEGYSLKKWCLKQWIYSHGYTQPYVARRLGVSAEEFKRKLREHEKFNEYQISCLVELMKAKAALTDIIKKYGREVSGSQSNINQK